MFRRVTTLCAPTYLRVPFVKTATETQSAFFFVNQLEAVAIRNGNEYFKDILRNATNGFVGFIDSTSALAATVKRKSKSYWLDLHARQVRAEFPGVDIALAWIRSGANGADAPSRLREKTPDDIKTMLAEAPLRAFRVGRPLSEVRPRRPTC